MGFLTGIFGRGKAPSKEAQTLDDRRGETALCISASDVGWTATFTEGDAIVWKECRWSAIEPPEAAPAFHCAEAMAKLLAAVPQAEVNRIVLGIDDAGLQLLDHRFANVTTFEPRILKEFGTQQSGGLPVVFSSQAFGVSSARETERRVLSFLPEERLESLFFALGEHATALTAVTPNAARGFFSEIEGGNFSELRVHGYFSTLAIANSENGLIAVRRIPFGALALAAAYSSAHGIALKDSVDALQTRCRLPASEWLHADPPPEHRTATLAALAPLLKSLREEIAASLDYFRYERLAGRPARLGLTCSGPDISGLDAWLEKAMELPVERLEFVSPAPAPDTRHLNLLKHCRPGLLKVGIQAFEFAGEKFVPVKETRAPMKENPKSLWTTLFPTFARLAKQSVPNSRCRGKRSWRAVSRSACRFCLSWATSRFLPGQPPMAYRRRRRCMRSPSAAP
jgi:hypothetical protein